MSLISHTMRRNGKWAPINNRQRRERLYMDRGHERLSEQANSVSDYFYFMDLAAAHRHAGHYALTRHYLYLARTQPNLPVIPG